MYYLNNSYATREFQGVTFKPGEIAEVPTWINDPSMIRVEAPAKPEPAKEVKPEKESKPASKGTSTPTAAKPAAKTTKQTAAKKSADTPTIETKEENTDGKHSDK